MSGPSAKRSADKNLKDSGPVSVNGQLTSMDTDGEDFDSRATSDSQMNTPNAKCFNTGVAISSLFGSINYDIDDEKEVIRKLFSEINGFGGATTSLKFEGIIKSMFTLSESMEKAVLLARENNIIVNSDLKRQRIYSDQAVVIKEMIIATVSEFGKIKSIKIQLIGLWQKAVVEFAELEQAVFLAARWSFLIGKDLVRVAMAVGYHETWASRNQFRALLFILPVGTTAHDFGDLLEGAGEKTCVINWLLETGNRVCCAVVCFDSDEVLEPANLDTYFQLAKLYVKKNVLISRPVAFGGKSWAQVVSVALVSHGFHAGSGSGSPPSSTLSSGEAPPSISVVNSPLSVRLALLECSVGLLSDQILNILSRLDNIGLALLAPSSQMVPSVVVSQSPTSVFLVVTNSDLDFDMAVDDLFVQPTSFSLGVTDLLLGLSSSKVLTSKVGGLELKLVALNISVGLILAKLDQLCAGSGSLVISLSQ
ncbi:hypothetical protein G9A89_006669 [Geosiphon pyriformis]|nr:hypothetical protein G9A89_006669 [Geosiphon pyriformis]